MHPSSSPGSAQTQRQHHAYPAAPPLDSKLDTRSSRGEVWVEVLHRGPHVSAYISAGKRGMGAASEDICLVLHPSMLCNV